ncbi:DUF1266 domain-containing protein [Volucribacter amazonae]|uniref:DUF1266 domain-containing protein n=1 Tax=Volucribacter amazonae TaxID=256731 RepID=A0A9X4PE68_9PAST|nr:DUF1266 domain-containing protein [Volucribacter amazonae]MDG6895624.1 hypothetical protein [Volucribacter amazonae]
MNIKQKLYLKQLDFLRPLLGLIILLGLLFFYGLEDFDKLFDQVGFRLPHWLIYALYAVFAIYALWRTFFGCMMLLDNKHRKKAKCFFALVKNKQPEVKIENIAEQYALLATLFYESSKIHFYDKVSLQGLANNADYIPPYRQDKQGNIVGGSHFINSLEAFYSTKATALIEDLKQALEMSWGITGRESALEQIDALWQGANEGAEYDLLASKEGKAYAQAVQDFGFQFACTDLPVNASGFDLVRFIYLVRAGFTLGYLDEQETRSALFSAAMFLAHHYRDWQHLAYSYLINFLIWNVASNNDSMAYNYALERVLCANEVLADPYSPLQGTSLDELRTALQALIQEEV